MVSGQKQRRNAVDPEKKEFGKWWMWVLFLVVVTVLVIFAFGSLGIFTQTVVERKVFEQSFQYSEARKLEIATYEAQLAELRGKLSNPNLDAGTRANIDAQIMAIQIQLNTARRRQ